MADPFSRHHADVDAAMRSGDPTAIKDAYRSLGTYLEQAAGDDLDRVPVLSFPETTPVVAAQVPNEAALILDAGCGPNPALGICLGTAHRAVVALDIGLGTVRLARSVAEGAGVRLLGIVGDVERLPFRTGALDAVVCDDTIEHLPDDRQGAAELARVTRAGGTVVVATPNRHSLEVLWRKTRDLAGLRRRPASHYYAAESHLREYTRRELARVLAGPLRVRGYASVGWTGGRRARWASRVVAVGPMRRLTRTVVAVAVAR